jgi:hypothetical protein
MEDPSEALVVRPIPLKVRLTADQRHNARSYYARGADHGSEEDRVSREGVLP